MYKQGLKIAEYRGEECLPNSLSFFELSCAKSERIDSRVDSAYKFNKRNNSNRHCREDRSSGQNLTWRYDRIQVDQLFLVSDWWIHFNFACMLRRFLFANLLYEKNIAPNDKDG